MHSHEKIAQILRVDKDVIKGVDDRLSAITGKKNVLEKILEQNTATIDSRLHLLGVNCQTASAKEIYDSLVKKLEKDDANLYKVLGQPKSTSAEDWQKILGICRDAINPPKGFFLKKEKAIEILKSQPPSNVIHSLGYRDVDELIANEDFFEVFSSLRFIEGGEWLSNVFFKNYTDLKPSDFEERELKLIALPEKWALMAQSFVQKKHHNISHLKELGVIYVIPLQLEISGETLRNFSLILHYFNEITFYTKLFRKFAQNESSFASNIISLLRGDVFDQRLPATTNSRWLLVQRYLTKEDPNDWRLFEPHINPEAIHWERAEHVLLLISRELKGFTSDLSFWHGLGWVGDYFSTDSGIDVLVSFNLVDTAMSLVKKTELKRYLYHQQEAMWNKIFSEYIGEEKMDEIINENIIKGYFEL